MPSALRTHLELALRDLSPRPLHVGFSGGADSTVLLHLLSTIPAARDASLRAIHVHHGLHPQADAWAAHCQRFCDSLGVTLSVLQIEVARGGDGLEAAARKARHAAFASVVGDDEVLALAHHQGDQAETFLLRALRASGPDGLGAMRPWRSFGRGWLWRPLLDTQHAELLAYAQHHGLRWIDDPSNADTTLDRNFLRNRVLPLLRERWPQADTAFARSAALNADAVELLDAEDAQALASVGTADRQVLAVPALMALPTARRARVLRRWIAGLGLPPMPAQGIRSIESELLTARSDADAGFAWSGAMVRRWRDLLHADHVRPPLPQTWSTAWDGRAPLQLPSGDTIAFVGAALAAIGDDQVAAKAAPAHAVAFDTPMRVHTRRGGERITLPGRTHSHALKHVLQDLGVPPWRRERLPLLSDAEGELLAAGDLVYSARFDAWLREHGARLVWEPLFL